MHEPAIDLSRFLEAQEAAFGTALEELQLGRKMTHWIWFIFPQLAGLGHSETAQFYAITSREEAMAYLGHPVLRQRLEACCGALLRHQGTSIDRILGFPDNLKLQSSMTLFSEVTPGPPNPWADVLDAFFEGTPDPKTLSILDTM